MIRNQFAPPKFKIQISGAIGWSDLKERVVRFQTVEFPTRKDADRAARELNPGEYTQGRIRVVPFEMAEDYDVYPVVERVSENPKSSS
jgi:hypothetical protein